MRSWWLGMAPRERILVSVAGLLTSLVVLVQFIVIPMLDHRDALRADLETSTLRLERIERAYQRDRATGFRNAASASVIAAQGEDLKAQITQSAREKGLAISRLQGTGGEVGLLIEQADPRLVFFWLEDVENRLGAQITSLTMEQSRGELVRVNVELVAGPVA
ncbi:MAG: type II secretion system protein GspM [Pseudomonadota bacterium]